jgi:energy-coupling factor transporter ATP-binding protein EcfA2
MPIIDVKNLSYIYPNTSEPILSDINLIIEAGEMVLVTGPSGCGKTTLCRCLNGLIPHFYKGELEGEITVASLPITEHSISDLAQHVGFVFQDPENQLFALSVEKDVAFGLENLAIPRNEIRKNVDWALDLLSIRPLKDVAPFELSGGQQQRVAIASVIAMKPDIIILDEPTSYLDPLTAKNLFEIIRQLNQELGITILLVEHRLNLLCTYVNRIILMEQGRICMDGPPIEVLTSKLAAELGIGIPKMLQLHQALSSRGIELGPPTLSIPEFSSRIKRRIIV